MQIIKQTDDRSAIYSNLTKNYNIILIFKSLKSTNIRIFGPYYYEKLINSKQLTDYKSFVLYLIKSENYSI